MTDLRNLLRSAARFPRGDLHESVLVERTRRRHRRRAMIVTSASAAALTALVGLIGVVAAAGDNHQPGSRVEVSSGTSAPADDTTTITIDSSTVPGADTNRPDTTNPGPITPTPAFATPGTISGPAPTTSAPSITATTDPTNTTQPATTAPTTTTVPPISGTGVVGSVTAGPTCPVEPPGGCPPKPVADTPVQALDSSGTIVGSDTTNANGNFAITLAPGNYTLHVAITGTFPRCTDVHITVTAGGPEQHDIGCDTGIR